jgi:hypothetical protein
VIGDLAIAKYLPTYNSLEAGYRSPDRCLSPELCRSPERGTGLADRGPAIKSIDFVVSKSSSPARVRKDIVDHPMSPLVDKAGDAYYRHTSGWEIEVKFIPDWVCPYLPSAARPVRQDVTTLPYISLDDLIVFKVDACGLRDSPTSKRREACEAAMLLELASEHTPLILESKKLDRIQQDLSDVVEYCSPEHNKAWWQMSLGLHTDHHRSSQEILSELSDHLFSPPATPTSSVHSVMSRASSYASSSSSVSGASATSCLSPEKHGRPRKMSVTSNAGLRHKRGISNTGPSSKLMLELPIHNLQLGAERPQSPGVALTDRIG